ncbi:MAG: hypothetical protein LW630_05955 [Saprospiraceae bacterium]|nr:hypothetical protein [Saprospiraceae bacterium]
MTTSSIFMNLAIKDGDTSREFWTKLGFSFREQFSDDIALCLVLHDGHQWEILYTEPIQITQ